MTHQELLERVAQQLGLRTFDQLTVSTVRLLEFDGGTGYPADPGEIAYIAGMLRGKI